MFNPPQYRDFSRAKNNTLDSLPLEDLAEICTYSNYDQHVEAFIESHGLALKPWFYPQALAHVAKWSIARDHTGLISPKSLVVDNCKNNPRNKGLYWILMSKHRAVRKQYQQTEFCSMVPLILAAFKKFAGIKYSEWNRDEVHYVISPALLEAATTVPPQYTLEEILQFRVQGLTTSDRATRNPGVLKSATTTYNLHGLPRELEDGRVGPGSLPAMLKMMICQTWCAHPQNRSPYMILDPLDWDHMPEPLLTDEVVDTSQQAQLEEIWK